MLRQMSYFRYKQLIYKIKNIFVRETKILVHIKVDEIIINTTEEYPFYVENVGWVKAKDLKEGDLLKLADCSTKRIDNVKTEKIEKPVKVYNFEVENWHTYFVSEIKVLLHNVCGNLDWHRMTSKESAEAAKKLGFEKINYRAKNGEPIYYNRKTKTYISQDIGSADGSGPHNGGIWKQAKSPETLNSKLTRMGTYDANLNRVGD